MEGKVYEVMSEYLSGLVTKDYLNSFIDSLNTIQDEISVIEYRRAGLVVDLVSNENIPIKDRFRIWSNNPTGKIEIDGVYEFRKMCPITSEYLFNKYDFDTNATVNVLDRLGDEEFYLYCMSDAEYKAATDIDHSQYWSDIEEVDLDFVEKMANELMKQNVKSFRYK